MFVAVVTVKKPGHHWSEADRFLMNHVFPDKGSAAIGIDWGKLFVAAEMHLRARGEWPTHGKRKMSGALESVRSLQLGIAGRKINGHDKGDAGRTGEERTDQQPATEDRPPH